MSSEYRRGFKKECEEIVSEVRAEMGLARYALFNPFAYAKKLLIPCEPINRLAENGCSAEHLAHIAGAGREDFSAITIYCGTRKRIFYNDHNSLPRQRSDVSHELSHILLEHEPAPLFDSDGTRAWDAVQEREASWLGGVLLIPEDVALRIARRGIQIEEAASTYVVSIQLMQWRLRMTGAIKRARYERNANRR